MRDEITITREIAPLPVRAADAHKGDVGRILVIGGCCNDTLAMVGAPALVANAALRAGAGLVQIMAPKDLRPAVATLAPCATTRTLPQRADLILEAAADFQADVIALGPGLGDSLTSEAVAEALRGFARPVVVDADGLNLLAGAEPFDIPVPHRVVLTPHPGEARRLLAARRIEQTLDRTSQTRRAAACELNRAFGCVIALKGSGTVVTNGDRLYVNETGNAGLATGGAGDVLTGVIAGLIGQKMSPFEAAILGVYLHGLAGDYAAEELGQRSIMATDVIEFLPEAISEHDMSHSE
jgi:NAD(P)H-hydrate epimerase